MSATGASQDANLWGRISRYLPQALQDGVGAVQRMSKYGELTAELLTTKDNKQVTEGTKFMAVSPTPGTGLATIAALSSFAATSPFIIIQNANPQGGRSIFMDQLRLAMTVLGTNAAGVQWACALDNIVRYSSGGSGSANTNVGGINGPYAPTFGNNLGSLAQVFAGALVASAASASVKQLGGGYMRTVAPVVGDTLEVNFGADTTSASPAAMNGTVPTQFGMGHPGVEIVPGSTFLFYLWSPSQTVAAQWTVEASFTER